MTKNSTLKALTLGILLSTVGFSAVKAEETKPEATLQALGKTGLKLGAKALLSLYVVSKYGQDIVNRVVSLAPKTDPNVAGAVSAIVGGKLVDAFLGDDAKSFFKTLNAFVEKQAAPVTDLLPL